MTVKKLKEIIKNLSDDMEVILQKDAEGNSYSPLSGVDADCIYVPDTTWSGEVYDIDWSADDCCIDEKEWEKIKKSPRALVLFPIN